MPWVEVNGSDIYYQEEGAGQPVVFLHGMSSCGEAWWQQFAHFRDRFRCISYDRGSLRESDDAGNGHAIHRRTV